MTNPRRQSRLVEQHRDELGILRQVWMQSLDRDRARKSSLTQEPAQMDRCHPARGFEPGSVRIG
jgi:hypothetical protein